MNQVVKTECVSSQIFALAITDGLETIVGLAKLLVNAITDTAQWMRMAMKLEILVNATLDTPALSVQSQTVLNSPIAMNMKRKEPAKLFQMADLMLPNAYAISDGKGPTAANVCLIQIALDSQMVSNVKIRMSVFALMIRMPFPAVFTNDQF